MDEATFERLCEVYFDTYQGEWLGRAPGALTQFETPEYWAALNHRHPRKVLTRLAMRAALRDVGIG